MKIRGGIKMYLENVWKPSFYTVVVFVY